MCAKKSMLKQLLEPSRLNKRSRLYSERNTINKTDGLRLRKTEINTSDATQPLVPK